MTVSGLLNGLPGFVATSEAGPADSSESSLFADEKLLLGERTVPSRRLEFALGRTAARRALVGLGMEPAPILRGASGEPLWPEGIVGSITHAAGRALAAVARREDSGGIGLDLEHRSRFFPKLGASVAFGQERQRLEGLPPDRGIPATLEIFSAKESIFKAFFPRVGRFFGFEAALIEPGLDGGYVARFVATLDTEYPPDRTFPVGCSWHGDLVFTSLILGP